MNHSMSRSKSSLWEPRFAIIGATILIVGVLVARGVLTGIFDGHLSDADSYMWMTRVLNLQETGGWFNKTLDRVNPPHGYEQHWTRLFDSILYLGASVGAPFLGFKEALYWWSLVISPLSAVLTVVSLYWGFAPVLGKQHRAPLGLLFLSQHSLLIIFQIGRPDNHLLQIPLFALTLGCIIRLLVNPFNKRVCYLAGLVAAVAVWVSAEGLLGIFVSQAILGMYWLLVKQDFGAKLFRYNLALSAGSLVALLLEHGVGGLSETVYDELSRVHVSLFVLITAFWWLIVRLEKTGRGQTVLTRLVYGLGGAALSALVMRFFFPDLFADPYADIDPLFRRLHHIYVLEQQPPVRWQALVGGQFEISWMQFRHWLGILLPAIPTLFYLAKKSPSPGSRAWIFIACALLIFLPLALSHRRLCRYISILLLPCYSYLVGLVLLEFERRLSRPWSLPLQLGTGFLAVAILCSPQVMLGLHERGDRLQRNQFIQLCDFLDRPEGLGQQPQRILININLGPEVIFRTKHSVYTIPCHRYHAGFEHSHRILSARDDDSAKDQVKKSKANLIVVEKNNPGRVYERGLPPGSPTFYRRIYHGKIPPWLAPVELPAGLRQSYIVYEINHSLL